MIRLGLFLAYSAMWLFDLNKGQIFQWLIVAIAGFLLALIIRSEIRRLEYGP